MRFRRVVIAQQPAQVIRVVWIRRIGCVGRPGGHLGSLPWRRPAKAARGAAEGYWNRPRRPAGCGEAGNGGSRRRLADWVRQPRRPGRRSRTAGHSGPDGRVGPRRRHRLGRPPLRSRPSRLSRGRVVQFIQPGTPVVPVLVHVLPLLSVPPCRQSRTAVQSRPAVQSRTAVSPALLPSRRAGGAVRGERTANAL